MTETAADADEEVEARVEAAVADRDAKQFFGLDKLRRDCLSLLNDEKFCKRHESFKTEQGRRLAVVMLQSYLRWHCDGADCPSSMSSISTSGPAHEDGGATVVAGARLNARGDEVPTGPVTTLEAMLNDEWWVREAGGEGSGRDDAHYFQAEFPLGSLIFLSAEHQLHTARCAPRGRTTIIKYAKEQVVAMFMSISRLYDDEVANAKSTEDFLALAEAAAAMNAAEVEKAVALGKLCVHNPCPTSSHVASGSLLPQPSTVAALAERKRLTNEALPLTKTVA